MKRILNLFAGTIAVLAGLMLVIFIFGQGTPAPPAPPDNAAICKATVLAKNQFKDPSSVRFDYVKKANTTDGGIYYSLGVSAKNSFGGYAQMNCGCTILKDASVHLTCTGS